MEQAVTFKNGRGENLFGIVHIPAAPVPGAKKIGINLLHPGIKYRVAPNRFNVKLARRLCQKGYYVLRFDPAGIGDSEGDLHDGVLLQNIFEEIQDGLFVQDTITANDYFTEKFTIDTLVLAGNCGGAITSLMASQKDSRIDALCLIDVPINLRTSIMTFADKVPEGGEKADWYFSEYIKKAFSAKAWYRFITFKTEYKALWKLFKMKMKKMFPFADESRLSDSIEKLCGEAGLNRHFFVSIEKYLEKKKPVLFAMADNDPGTEIFHRYFQDGYLKDRFPEGGYEDFIDIAVIKNANHVYTLIESQESVMSTICKWIDAHTGGYGKRKAE